MNIQMIELGKLFHTRSVRVGKYADELLKSIKERGIINPLTVREVGNRFEIIDGIRRFNCAEQCDYQKVPCNIVNVTDDQITEARIIESELYVKTTKAQYKQALKCVMKANPDMTLEDFAKRLGKTVPWLKRKLKG